MGLHSLHSLRLGYAGVVQRVHATRTTRRVGVVRALNILGTVIALATAAPNAAVLKAFGTQPTIVRILGHRGEVVFLAAYVADEEPLDVAGTTIQITCMRRIH